MEASLGPDFDKNEFPCSFNLSPAQELRPARLKTVEHTLTVELKNGTDCESEIIQKKNLLSFIYFHLGEQIKAAKLSDELVELTKRRNVATLANRRFILLEHGDELEVRECGNKLQSLKKEKDFQVLVTEAKAEQAYYYLRLGGPENLRQAEMLFSEVVNEVPTNYLWKYDLGLACRRATHGDILSCSPKPVDLDTLIKNAIQYFFEVADNGENWLKSMAYAELVNLRQVHTSEQFPQYDVLFRSLSVEDLVDKALEDDRCSIPSVLTQCGNALCWLDTDKSIELLERSGKIKPSSRTYHYLGKSYKRKALLQPIINNGCLLPGYPEAHAGEQPTEGGAEALQDLPLYSSGGVEKNAVENLTKRREELGGSLSEQEIIASSRKPGNQAYLNGDDELVKKAVSYLEKAIELSIENVPAVLDLAILLNETGDTKGALKQFNKVTNSKLAPNSHRVSAISAFEQAGLCYLKLGQAGPRDNEDEEAGKRKLTRAVSQAAELALSRPELQGKTQELWTAFETLMNKIDEEQSSSTYIKEKVKLLELAQKYRQIIDIFQNIPASNWNELGDKEIASVIKSYHKESKFEDALALQNIISLRPDVRESDWWKTGDLLDLRIKSLLHAAAGRLEKATDTPIGLFQQVFQLLFGACFGAQGKNDHNPQAGSYVGDVLIVFNDDEEVDKSPYSSTVTSLGLQQVATSLFGLETQRNLKRSAEYGNCLYEAQLQEMRQYQVVIIVLGSEKRCLKFNAMLENVLVNISPNEPTKQRRTLIIDAGPGDGQIPLGMNHYERFKLTNISGLRCADPSPDNEGNGDQLSYVDILERGFHGDVNAVMKLFCLMVGQKWPGS